MTQQQQTTKFFATIHGKKYPTEPSPTGEKTTMKYKRKFLEDGSFIVENDTLEDTYQKIQLYKDESNIEMLIKRYENGDVRAIPPSTQNGNIDVSEMQNAITKDGNMINYIAELKKIIEKAETIQTTKQTEPKQEVQNNG